MQSTLTCMRRVSCCALPCEQPHQTAERVVGRKTHAHIVKENGPTRARRLDEPCDLHLGRGSGSRVYPNKPVTLIVPFQAGISVDILLRGIAEIAGQHLGQPVMIDNKAGGSATLGPAHMASNAKPDGYTIAQIPMPVLRVPHLQKVTYDPLKDFTWIIQLGGYTIGVVVSTASEFKTFKDVIAFAKANPGKLTYTTPGPSTLNSIAMELVARKEGTTLAHVPVPGKGGGEAWMEVRAVVGPARFSERAREGYRPQIRRL